MTLQDVVRQAITSAPRSLRALAKAAGLSHVTLLRIRQGREPVSKRVAVTLARVLDAWAAEERANAKTCDRSATRIRTTLQGSRGRKR
jgi:hypothetical protein